MGADEFHTQGVGRIADREAKAESGTALENIRFHLSNANSAVRVRPPELFRKLKQREPCVVARGPFEFREQL